MKRTHRAFLRHGLRLCLLVLLCAVLVLPAFAADWDGALKAIQDGMKKEQEEIDISAYDIPKDGFWDQYKKWYNAGKFPWYVAYGGTAWHVGDQETSVCPKYLDSSYDRKAYEAAVERILEETVHEGMSGWQIALSVHDYLVTICEYDQRWYSESENANYQGYDCIVKGLAVCDGYTKAYMDLMNRAGIPCIRVVSGDDQMDHSWNIIKLGSDWYHVDVTWDDPSFSKTDVEGYVGHNYFLLSDATISDSEHNHYGWDAPYKCSSTKYELSTDPYWEDVKSQIIWLDDSVSFWRDGDNRNYQIKRRDANTGISTVLYEAALPTVNVGSGNYYYWMYGLSYWNGLLYFNDATTVYSLELTGGALTPIHYNDPASGTYIQGCQVKDGIAYLTLNTHDDVRTEQRIRMPVGEHSHSYAIKEVAPTCVAEGYTSFTCSCGSSFVSGKEEPSEKGHSYQITERKDPTTLEGGYIVRVCSLCGDSQTQELDKLSNPFKDVKKGAYYEEPVMWAVAYGITTGTSKTKFSPNDPCTRGQVVTFLWRAEGSPEPASGKNPFKDVKSDAYYYKAVLWAVEKGITTGTSKTKFSPNDPCTRGQVATFLHRAEGSAAPVFCAKPFTDVASGAYYDAAIMWAVEMNITSGVGNGRFAPNDTCTRGQIVTFLRRADQAEGMPPMGNISGYDPYTAAACSIRTALEYSPEGSDVYAVEINFTESTKAGYPLVEGWYYWEDASGKQHQFWCVSVVHESGEFAGADRAIHVDGTYWVSTVIYDTDPVTDPEAYGYTQLDTDTCIETYQSLTFS